MGFRFNCKSCSQNIYVRELKTGAVVRCRKCNAYNEIPHIAVEEPNIPDEEYAPFYQENPLGPRDFERLLTEIKDIYLNKFGQLIGIYSIINIPVTLLMIFWFIPVIYGAVYENDISVMALIIGMTFMFVINLAAQPLMFGALFYLVCSHFLRKEVKVSSCFSAAAKRWPEMIASTILFTGAMISLSISIIGIPAAVFLLVAWSVYIAVIMVEDPGVIEAFRRSFYLTKDHWLRILGIMVLVFFVSWFLSMMLSMFPVIGAIVASLVFGPIFSVLLSVLYFDLKVRKENYTPEQLDADLKKIYMGT